MPQATAAAASLSDFAPKICQPRTTATAAAFVADTAFAKGSPCPPGPAAARDIQPPEPIAAHVLALDAHHRHRRHLCRRAPLPRLLLRHWLWRHAYGRPRPLRPGPPVSLVLRPGYERCDEAHSRHIQRGPQRCAALELQTEPGGDLRPARRDGPGVLQGEKRRQQGHHRYCHLQRLA